MSAADRRLGELVVRSPCHADWEQMSGSDQRRFCAACRRQVLDFARLTPRQIQGHLQASRGVLCGRLTHRHGRLVVRPPAPDEPLAPRPRPAAPAMAALLLSAWLGATRAGAAAAAAPPPPIDLLPGEPGARPLQGGEPTAAIATLQGRVVDETGSALPGVTLLIAGQEGVRRVAVSDAEGHFTFAALPAGTYDLQGALEGFMFEPRRAIPLAAGGERREELVAALDGESLTMGVIVSEPKSLRQVFRASTLVVSAVVGSSRVVGREDGLLEVISELRVDTILEGVGGRSVAYRHWIYQEPNAPPHAWRSELPVGTPVLAFLEATDEATDRAPRPVFEAVDYGWGLKRLAGAVGEAYVQRLEALVRLDRRAERLGEPDPAALVDWLVATAEEPLTRAEATGELQEMIAAFAELAAEHAGDEEAATASIAELVERMRGAGEADPPAELLGAFFAAQHRDRLTAALVATASLGEEDLALCSLVRLWDEEAALGWLRDRLAAVAPEAGSAADLWWLHELAEQRGDPALRAVTAAALRRLDEINARWPVEGGPRTRARHEREVLAMRQQLRLDFAAALVDRRP